MSDAIFLKGLALHAYHGVMQHEAKVGQTFLLDLVLDLELGNASRTDMLKDTVSYDIVIKIASEAFCARRHRLVEAAAGAVADAVLARCPQVRSVRVTVHKPHAPIAATFDDVGVTIERPVLVNMTDPSAEALLALGGNVGDVRATFDRAVQMLCADKAVRLVARSSDYRTPPWGVTDQPAFVNAVIAVATSLDPLDLFMRAVTIERALGRERDKERRWGPRTIDIDILAYNDVVMHDPGLTLPHPRLFERGFVLMPLAEIAPDRVIAGIRVRDALARVDLSAIEKLPPSPSPAAE
jgi:2-amino-4-hydroxy-6-hydroxymethyldihydropteridine diphosphokinase/dihydroneopterin aldolase